MSQLMNASNYSCVASALVGWLFGACGAAEQDIAAPAEAVVVDTTPRPLPAAQFYIPGESMTFEFHFRDVPVGEAALAVGQPGVLNGRPTLIVRSELKTAGLGKVFKVIRDDVTSWLDTARGRTVRQRADMIFGERDMKYDIRVAGQWVFIELLRRGPKYQGKRKRFARTRRQYRLPKGEVGHDSHSVLGALRAWEGQPGQRLYFYAVSGSRVWRSDLEFKGSETRTFAKGLYPALRFEGTASRVTRKMELDTRRKPRTFTMWLSDDLNRLPLLIEGRTEYGTAAVKLVGYRKPRKNLARGAQREPGREIPLANAGSMRSHYGRQPASSLF